MKKYNKIIRVFSLLLVPLGVAGITLGVTFGTNNKIKEESYSKSKNNAEKYYDKILKKSNFSLANKLIFPPGGKNLYLKENLIEFTKNNSNEKAIKMIDGNSPVKIWSIDFSNDQEMQTYSDTSKRFVQINSEISQYLDDKKSKEKKYGIYWTKEPKERKVLVELYLLKNEEKDKDLIDNYFNDLKDSKTNKLSIKLNPIFDFIESNQPKRRFWRKNLYNSYGLEKFKSEASLNFIQKKGKNSGPFDFRYFDIKKNMIQTGQFEENNKNFMNIINYEYTTINQDLYLIKNKFFVLHNPVSDFEDGSVKVVFKFYKMDNDSFFEHSQNTDIVINPKNIYKKVLKIPLKHIFENQSVKIDPEDNQDLNAHIDVNGSSVIIEDKDSKKQTKNKEIIYKRLTENWMSYIDLPLVIPGLKLMGNLIPTTYSHIFNFLETINVIKKLKLKGKLEELFKEKDSEGKDLIDKIVDALNKADSYIQPSLIWKELFKNFRTDKDSKWANIESMASSGIYKKQDGNPSSGRILYHFVAGLNIIEKPIRERIKSLYGDGTPRDPYESFDDDQILEDLLFLLKENKVIPQSTTLTKIIGKPFRYVGYIIDSLWNDKSFPIDKKYFRLILSILGKDVSKSDEEKFINTLGDFFSDARNVQSLVKLLKNKKYNGESIIKQIMNDPYSLVKIIGENIGDNKGFLEKLGHTIFDKDLVSLVIKIFTGSSTDFSPLIKGLINGFGTPQDLLDSLSFLNVPKEIKNLLEYSEDFDSITMFFSAISSKANKDKATELLTKFLIKGFKSLSLEETSDFISLVIDILQSPSLNKAFPSLKSSDLIKKVIELFSNDENLETVSKILYYLTR